MCQFESCYNSDFDLTREILHHWSAPKNWSKWWVRLWPSDGRFYDTKFVFTGINYQWNSRGWDATQLNTICKANWSTVWDLIAYPLPPAQIKFSYELEHYCSACDLNTSVEHCTNRLLGQDRALSSFDEECDQAEELLLSLEIGTGDSGLCGLLQPSTLSRGVRKPNARGCLFRKSRGGKKRSGSDQREDVPKKAGGNLHTVWIKSAKRKSIS